MIDIQNDENLTILGGRLRDLDNYVARDLLKEANIENDYSDLVDEAFADRENRKFPIFSPETAITSALYMQVQEVPELVKEACKKALEDWGIEGISPELKIEKENIGIPEDRFLLHSKMKLPVVDEESLEKSASALNGIFGSLSMAEKVRASSKLYKFATEEFGYSPDKLNEDVRRYALKVPCDLNKLASSISERYAETHYDGYKGMIEKIANLKNEINGSISFDSETNNAIGMELFELDKDAGVTDIFDAIYDTFNSPYVSDEELGKVAAHTPEMINVGGFDINVDDLRKVSSADIDSVSPGLSDEIFDGDSLSAEKLKDKLGYIPYSASYALGKMLSEL